MKVWKQIVLSVAVLLAGAAGAVWLVPGAGAALVKMGVPEGAIAAIGGKTGDAASAGAPGGRAQGGQGGQGQGQGRRQEPPPLVVIAPVSSATVNSRLEAIGTGQARSSVSVTADTTGIVTEIAEGAGRAVKKGEVIAKLDDVEERLARDKAEATLKGAADRLAIYQNATATAPRLDRLNAETAEATAKVELDIARDNLDRRSVKAPIDGVTGIVQVNAGEKVTADTVILTIDDRSALLVDFYVPERFIARLEKDMPVTATSQALPGEIFTGTIVAIDSRADAASRTLRVRAEIPNQDDRLRPGTSFRVTLNFPGDTYPAVDPLSVLWDFEGSYVWRINAEGKAEKVRVTILERDGGRILIKGDIANTDKIVSEGTLRLRPGVTVRIAGDAQKTAEVTP